MCGRPSGSRVFFLVHYTRFRKEKLNWDIVPLTKAPLLPPATLPASWVVLVPPVGCATGGGCFVFRAGRGTDLNSKGVGVGSGELGIQRE
jgi:hypothetical protein